MPRSIATHLALKWGKAVHDERRMPVCQLLVRSFEIIAAEPIFMSDAAKTELAYIGPMFRRIYFQLSEEALANKVRLYKAVPKFHIVEHICLHQSCPSTGDAPAPGPVIP